MMVIDGWQCRLAAVTGAWKRVLLLASLSVLLAACSSSGKRIKSPSPGGAATAGSAAPEASGGGYYLDDGPHARPPANLDEIADARPRAEPLHRFANRPYTVLGQSFVPMTALKPFRQRGHGSWYGRRFHGKPTSSGEPYDMYAMTAAHPTLPIPSYARVSNVANGRSVVVRVNDRGPFLRGRIIDLSYTAAHKLDYIRAGSAELEVELILPAAITETVASSRPEAAAVAAAVTGTLDDAVFLQLAAFSSRDNAEALRARLAADFAGRSEAVEVLADGRHFRLRAGPYPSVQAAQAAAVQLGRRLQLKPFVIKR